MARAQRVGMTFAVLSAATFGTSGTFGGALIDAGWSPAAAVTARITLAAVVLTVPALLQLAGRWWLLQRTLGAILGYGLVAVAACQLCYFNAVQHISVSVALLIEYLGILLVVGWAWARYGRRPRRLTLLGGAIAITGLALVLDLTGSRLDPVGIFWSLAAAVGCAVYYVLSASVDESLPPLVLAWAGLAVGALALWLSGALGVTRMRMATRDVRLAGHQVSWLVAVLGLAVIAAAAAYVLGIEAARRLGSKLASFAGLLEVVCAVLFAWAMLGQRPGLLQLAGGVLIVCGVAAVRWDELRGERIDQLPGKINAQAK